MELTGVSFPDKRHNIRVEKLQLERITADGKPFVSLKKVLVKPDIKEQIKKLKEKLFINTPIKYDH